MAISTTIRLGFIGAGGIARSRHLPNLARIKGVQVVAVANRSRESGQAIAKDFGIAEVMDDWRALVARADLDAVFIGTWPYMHKEMSIAALEAGKHVFCQARMAMNVAEAHAMLAAASAHPGLVNMICPPPTRMPFEPYIQKLLASGGLGRITAVELHSVGGGNLDLNKVHWRERIEFSGRQVLALGIYAETLNAWVGPYERLSAVVSTPIQDKADGANMVRIAVPQVVSITGTLRGGIPCTERHMGVAVDQGSRGDGLTIWGLEGTLRYGFGKTIELAKPGGTFAPVDVPADLQRDWRVEEDFIAAVRQAQAARPWRVSPDFREGLLYMQKVEAVHLSAATGKAVEPASL